MPPTEQAQWFSEQVQPCEPALRAYLQKRFPSLPDHDDLVQETYIRTVRAKESGRLTHAKGFLFTTARNVAIDLIRRRHGMRHETISEVDELPLLDETPGVVESIDRQ
ncbi:MAG: RNA polymerase sigma factor, partial [Opitutaceae bacterium]